MANNKNGAIYVGVTSNLIARVYQHKQQIVDGFAKKYNCKYLVYYEHFENMLTAISREK